MAFASILDAIGNTPLVRLSRFSPKPGVDIYAKLEGQNPTGSLKDRIALYMIRAAEESGELTAEKTILEPTSGNTGISLAMIARAKGYRLICVLPDIVTPERYYMPYQYGNENNPRAHYETTGPEILRELPQVDVFVAGLGTGGSLTGVGRYLKERRPQTKVIAAVPHPGDLVQGLRDLGEGFIPPVLDESVLDGRVVVDSLSSFAMVKELMEREAIFAGISSGAVLKVAVRAAKRLERGNVVALLADGGWKYLSTELWTKDWAVTEESEVQGKIWW